jgi:hypothetical protein
MNGLRMAGVVLAIATCCAGTEAGAQFRAYVGPGPSGPFGSTPAPGSAGLGTSGLGVGGFGSATQNLVEPTPGDGGPAFGLPLQNHGAGSALGVTGNAGAGAAGAGQGSLSSAVDRSSSPINSVTNSLMGPVSNAISQGTKPATSPTAKKKQNGNAVAASSSDHGAASKVSPAKTP